jgi:hypothetical protein
MMAISFNSNAFRIFASTFAIFSALSSSAASSSEIPVTPDTPPDIGLDERCSLIEAIENANTDSDTHSDCAPGSGADIIVLPPSSFQLLNVSHNSLYGATGLPVISSEITIEGNNSTIARADLAPAFRILAVDKGAVLRMNLVEIAAGSTSDTGIRQGGGVLNYGTFEITNSRVLRNNSGHHGGGIFSFGGELVVRNTTLSNNTAGAAGGAIAQVGNIGSLRDMECIENSAMQDGGCMWVGGTSETGVLRSIIDSNRARGAGGGLRVEWNSLLTVSATTVTNNLAAASGGGLSSGAHATLHVMDTTIAGNSSDAWGGGVFAGGTSLHMKNSTVSGNFAPSGGGIATGNSGTSGGSSTIMSSTIVFNQASLQGGGVLNSAPGPFYLSHTLLSGNTAGNNPSELHDTKGVSFANSFNLIGYGGRAVMIGLKAGPTDIVPAKKLGSILDRELRDNGGPTQTHALLARSPAVNAGDPRYGNMGSGRSGMFDQRGRGFGRFGGTNGRVDIGAFEIQ